MKRAFKIVLINLFVLFLLAEIAVQWVYYCIPDSDLKVLVHESVARKYSDLRVYNEFWEFNSRRILLPPAGKADILIVGDSVPFGFLLKRESTFPPFIQSLTGKKVVNLGVQGTYPLYYNRMVEVGVERYAPDIVLYCVFANDLIDPLFDRTGWTFEFNLSRPPPFDDLLFVEHTGLTHAMARLRKKILNTSKALLLIRRLADYSVIWAAGLLRDVTPVQLEGYTSYCHPKFWNTALNLSNPLIQAQFQNTLQYIGNAHDFVAAHNIKFFVVLIPCKEMIYGPITREFDASALLLSYDELGRRLENDGIRVLNLSTSFVDAESGSKQDVLFLRTDVHLTESGHQAVADMVVRFMQGNGLLCLE